MQRFKIGAMVKVINTGITAKVYYGIVVAYVPLTYESAQFYKVRLSTGKEELFYHYDLETATE